MNLFTRKPHQSGAFLVTIGCFSLKTSNNEVNEVKNPLTFCFRKSFHLLQSPERILIKGRI